MKLQEMQAKLIELQTALSNDPENADLKKEHDQLLKDIEQAQKGGAAPGAGTTENKQPKLVPMPKEFEEKVKHIKSQAFDNDPKSKEYVFFSFIQDARFDPRTGKKLTTPGRDPFVTSCHMLDCDRFVNFHKKQQQHVECIHHPQPGKINEVNKVLKIARGEEKPKAKK
jgi:hypothetical protein